MAIGGIAVSHSGQQFGQMFNGFGLVLLDADDAAGAVQHLLHQRRTDQHLGSPFHHHAVIAGQVGLAFCAVNQQKFSFLARGRGQFDVGREGRTAQTDDAVLFDAVQNPGLVFGEFRHQIGRTVDAFFPFIPFHDNLDMGDFVAGEVFAGTDGLDGTAHRRVDTSRNKAAGLGYQLTDFDRVAGGDQGFGRGTQMLGHRHIDLIGQGQHLNGAVPGDFPVIGVNAPDGKGIQFLHHASVLGV